MRRVGDYVLLDSLGRGAMGAVHRARHVGTGRLVALKLVAGHDATHAARLAREASLAGRLAHPAIVKVLDAGVDGAATFVAFELVEGARTLGAALPGLDRRARVALVRDVARALGHAHACGVVHRDVKLDNVLVDAAGRARLTDFGIGLVHDLDRLTRSGVLVGTPRTMAPEQAAGKRDLVGPQTDVWALGVVLFEALVEEHPLFDEDPPHLAALIQVIVQAEPRRARDVDPTVPAALDAVVLRALRRDPRDRFPDGEAMARALDDALASLAPRRRRRRRGHLVVAVALGALAVALGAWAGVQRARAEAALDRGLRLLAAGEAAAAVSALRVADALAPGVAGRALPPALLAVAEAAVVAGDLDGAERALRGAGAAPGAAVVAFDLALARGDLEAATGRLAGAVDEGAGDAARRRLALALLERARARTRDRPADGAGDLAAALRLAPDLDARDALLGLAYAAAGAEHMPGALEEAVAALEDDLAAEAWLVHAFRLVCREAPAREAAGRALARARAPDLRAEALYLLGRGEEALALVERHLADPRRGFRAGLLHARLLQDVLFTRGLHAADLRDLVARWTALIERDPTHYLPHLFRGQARLELGDRGATADVARACALAPPWFLSATQQLTGYVHLRLGEGEAAERALDQALLADEWNSQARKQRGLVRRARGDLAGARADLERQAAELPASVDVELWLALLELRSHDGDAEGASGAAGRLREVLPDRHAVELAVVRALAQVGDLPGAEARASALLGPDLPAAARAEAAALRARVRAERGDAAGALADAERALAGGAALGLPARALARVAAGDVAGGEADAARALARPTSEEHLGWALTAHAWSRSAAGAEGLALLADLDRALALGRGPATLLLALRADARRDVGDVDGARADARAVLARLEATCPDAWTALAAREVLAGE
ncbi:MAG: protein kinase [Planctomycetes bacterium]|nr:protein kinase [Planctomycetota bacterium]